MKIGMIRRGLPLLAAVALAALGASPALAAPAHGAAAHALAPHGTRAHLLKALKHARRAPVGMAAATHSINHCGYTALSPGTYNVTKNLNDSGSGNCIDVKANNVTLNLNSHTITGTGSDTCIYVEQPNSSVMGANDTIVGGPTTKTGTKPATLTNCSTGMYFYYLLHPVASYVNITNVPPYGTGVYTEYVGGANLHNIHADTGTLGSANGFELYYGARNTLTADTVNNGGGSGNHGFYIYEEAFDQVLHDSVTNSYNNNNSGYGFYDYESNQNTFSYDKAIGQYYGFYLDEDYDGTVTATHNLASGRLSTGYGFYVYYAFQEYDTSPATPHTTIANNTVNGYGYGYYDSTDDSDYSVREVWTGNTANNFSNYGFYFGYTTDYTIAHNTAEGSTAKHKYASGTYGFYFDESYSYYLPLVFSYNKSSDSQWGYYSPDNVFAGKSNVGNTASRDQYSTYNVDLNN